MPQQIGTVAALRRYPVKSMLGEEISQAQVTDRGLAGDRAYALLEAETGKLVSAKRPRKWARMFAFRAFFTKEPRAGAPLPPASIRFPDGTERTTGDPDVEDALSAALGRAVRVTASGDDVLMFEEEWNGELKGGGRPYGPIIGEQDGDPLIDVPASLGVPGGFFDGSAVHFVTTASLAAISAAAPESRFDVRRFRPNLVIETPDLSGFVENDWTDRLVAIGDAVRIRVLVPVPRCVMTTLPQEDLPHDPNVLRSITRSNRVESFADTRPCLGVYCEVERSGTIRAGDRVALD